MFCKRTDFDGDYMSRARNMFSLVHVVLVPLVAVAERKSSSIVKLIASRHNVCQPSFFVDRRFECSKEHELYQLSRSTSDVRGPSYSLWSDLCSCWSSSSGSFDLKRDRAFLHHQLHDALRRVRVFCLPQGRADHQELQVDPGRCISAQPRVSLLGRSTNV